MDKLTIIILTKNSEKTIKKCIESCFFADDIIVLDDNSTDKTVKIIKSICGVKITVLKRGLNADFAAQRNFALQKAKSKWVLFVDSDEAVSSSLAKEIIKIIKKRDALVGYYVKRKDYMWGKEIIHGESGNIRLLRLGEKNAGIWKGKVHETWSMEEKTGLLSNELFHYPHQTITEFLDEIDLYTKIRSDELFKKEKVSFIDIVFYPVGKFIVNYFLKKGFMDKEVGVVFALMMSFHSFLVRAKLYLRNKNK